jgi:hypothetical protein
MFSKRWCECIKSVTTPFPSLSNHHVVVWTQIYFHRGQSKLYIIFHPIYSACFVGEHFFCCLMHLDSEKHMHVLLHYLLGYLCFHRYSIVIFKLDCYNIIFVINSSKLEHTIIFFQLLLKVGQPEDIGKHYMWKICC